MRTREDIRNLLRSARHSAVGWMLPLLGLLLFPTMLSSQDNTSSNVDVIIKKIEGLENTKDAKCYATASRLEDFMYGTPLDNQARNLKIEIQKEIAMFIMEKASQKSVQLGLDSIGSDQVNSVTDSLSVLGTLKDGNIFYKIDSGYLVIKKIDYDQYSSVAYGYRAILSVQQDLMFSSVEPLLPLSENAVSSLNSYLNIATLASLQLADAYARDEGARLITEPNIRAAWTRALSNGPYKQELFTYEYPRLSPSDMHSNNQILKQIIQQKLTSYEQYNALSQSVFLRNVQVFFAKQRWPVDEEESTELKNFYLESLIAFTEELIKQSSRITAQREDQIIRVADVQLALQLLLPHELNSFEDVVYFPNDNEGRIRVESYDLDAFRDGGIHWRILDYAISTENSEARTIDPHAAELIVEGVAQLGVLVLRLAGAQSQEEGKEVLDMKDLEQGFQMIQDLIDEYPGEPEQPEEYGGISSSPSSETSSENQVFFDVTDEVGIAFEHKSADWLSRKIRSYVYSEEDRTAKLAIPPAFGGSGVASEDINNDGLDDILLLGGLGNKLYLNKGDGAFEDATDTYQINVWDEESKSFGEPRQPIIADFNNDGFQDLLVIYVNGGHQMYKNFRGEHFQNVSAISHLGGNGAVAGPATALDFDNDGLLDIFIGYFGNYLDGVLPTLSRDNQNGMPNRLFQNMGDFMFREVKFTPDVDTDNGWTQAVGHTDIDQDGRQDLIVGNDFGVNRYYLNTPDRGFVEMGKQWKTDKPSYTMNVGIGDVNKDQFPDLYISNIVVMQKEEKYVSPNENTVMKFNPEKMPNIRTVEANDLFLSNAKGGTFSNFELSDAVGRGYGATGWSWDADFFDYDNDGDEDLYCLNGMNDFSVYSSENPFYYNAQDSNQSVTYAQSNREKNVFFVNENGILSSRSQGLGADLESNSRSASYLDYDGDGDLDIIINNYHDRAVFLANRQETKNNWIKIKLVGDPESGVNRDAIGSSITVDTENYHGLWREVHSTTGYLSVHPKMQHIGLGGDEQADVKIKWSDGSVKTLSGLQANNTYVIRYPNIIEN